MRKNYARMVSKGKLCPSELQNTLKVEIFSDLLGTAVVEFDFLTKVPEPDAGSTWKPQYIAFNSEMVLEEAYAEVTGEVFTLPTI